MKLKKLWPFKIEGVKNFKKQTTKCYKNSSQTLTKFFVCCFVAFKLPR
jgi:hypothetical protein